MKKFLSIFLISAMILSLFTGVTAFAASEATGDGGTLWHMWDFENGIVDTVNNITPTNNAPEKIIDSGLNIGKFGGATAKTVAIINTENTLSSSQDRYVVVEFDFKRGTADSNCYFGARNNADTTTNNFLSFDKINQGDTNWVHIVVVVDRTINLSSKYGVYAYSVVNGTYNAVENPNYKNGIASNEFMNMRIQVNANHTIYIDNLELKTYKNFYEIVNSASDAQTVLNAIDRFAGMGFVTMPVDYSQLTAAQKLSVAGKLLNKNFASDDAVITAISSAIRSEVVVKTYLNWDFEDGTLNDSVTAEPFMQEGGTAILPVIGEDPTNSDNKTAIYDYSASGTSNIVTFTSVMDDAYAAGEYKYLVYDFKVYGDTTKDIPIYQDLRMKNGVSGDAFYSAKLYYKGKEWHKFRGVINIVDGQVRRYKLNGAKWELYEKEALPANLGFYRLGFTKSGCDAVVHYDDFKVTGYKDVISAINAASADDIADMLELYNEIGIVELPTSYASLDAGGKAALGTYIKSKTYTSVQTLNDDIAVYLSNDELVVLSADATSTALNGLKLAVKKDGVILTSSKLVIAAYDGTELVSVKVCDVAADGTVTNLGVDISSADSVKLMLVNNMTSLTPAVKATALK